MSGSCVRIMSNCSPPFILSTPFMFLKQLLPDYNWNGYGTDIWDLLYLKALFHFLYVYNNTHFYPGKPLRLAFLYFSWVVFTLPLLSKVLFTWVQVAGKVERNKVYMWLLCLYRPSQELGIKELQIIYSWKGKNKNICNK